MSCLAYIVDVIVEGQSIVTPRLFTVRVTGTVTPATVTSFIFGSDLCLACAGADDDCFGFVWIQTKAVGIQPAMNGLETVITLTALHYFA